MGTYLNQNFLYGSKYTKSYVRTRDIKNTRHDTTWNAWGREEIDRLEGGKE
jgi:hypothetical protein